MSLWKQRLSRRRTQNCSRKLLTEGKRPRVEELVRSMLSEDPELVQAVRRADSERLKKMARAEARRILGNEDGEKRLAELEADFQ